MLEPALQMLDQVGVPEGEWGYVSELYPSPLLSPPASLLPALRHQARY